MPITPEAVVSRDSFNMKRLYLYILLTLLTTVSRQTLEARVTGECSNCHTMHNSQGGSPMAYELSGGSFSSTANSNAMLLVTDCVGCHSAIDGSTWQDSTTGAPIVYNVSAPTYGASSDGGTTHQGLAAGNFYWVDQDDAYGHNIFSDDANLNEAPGESLGCKNDSCHVNFDQPYAGMGHLNGRTGCLGCHMVSGSAEPSITRWHHADDSDAVVDTSEEGWLRFLSGHRSADGYGASGIEDVDWQKTTSSTDHNEYYGKDADKTDDTALHLLGNAITGFCVGCHGEFHMQDTTAAGASPWYRHPSDAVIPSSGEYASYITYDPIAPVARPSLSGWTNPSGTVTPGTDLVMCLSCHRAHASPYYKILRWDYRGWPGNTSTDVNGCSVCHTSKD